jgi:hypothetical protein
MKRKLNYLFILLLFFAAHPAATAQITGNPAEDAKTILKYYNNKNGKEFYGALGYYFGKNNIEEAAAKKLLENNIFLLKFIDSIHLLTEKKGSVTSPTAAGSPFGFATILADGIAQFLIERGKQELSLVFFERLKNDLKKYPELTYLFPLTSSIITEIENHNILNLLQELKDAFMKDLLKLPGNLLSLRGIKESDCNAVKENQQADCKSRVKKISEFFTSPGGKDARLLTMPLILIQSIIDGDNIIEISESLVADESTCKKDDPFSNYLRFVSIILQSLQSSSEKDGLFINSTDLKALFASDDLMNLYLGLVLEKYRNKDCYADLKIGKRNLQEMLVLIRDTRTTALNAFSVVSKINIHFLSVKKQLEAGKEIEKSSFASLVSSSLKTIPEIINWVKYVTKSDGPENFDKLSRYLDLASSVCSDIQQKNYAGIFNGIISFINQSGLFAEEEKTKTAVVKYLAFAANLSSAKTSAEVKEAINAVALPPGSYSVKQKSYFNISLNGYIGYAWDIIKKDVYANGVYAPVGFSFSKGLGKNFGGAITVFSSVIDVGSLASYRLRNGTTDELKQEVRFESIISPSAQLLLEVIPKTPVAIGFGWRKTPKLFYKDDSGFETVNRKDVFNISVLIDIPIFTLFNKSY